MNASKIYSILMVVNYEKSNTSSAKWNTMVKTIQQNLLGSTFTQGCGWFKFNNLPDIKTSVVDIVETIDDAIDYMSKTTPDVVILEDRLGNEGVGVGKLRSLKDICPNTLYIMLLDKNQKKGAVDAEGKVSQGKKVASLHEKGFYNAMYKNNIDVAELINMIISGGYTSEQALSLYGLDQVIEETPVVVEENNSEAETPVVEEVKEEVISEDKNDTATTEPASSGIDAFLNADLDDVKESENDKVVEDTTEEVINNDAVEESEVKEEPQSVPTVTVDDLPKLAKSKKESVEVDNDDTEKVVYCLSKVSFVQNDTVILKTDQSPADVKMELQDIIKYPVAIPYIKRNIKTDEISYCMSKVSFMQDDTIVLQLDKSLAEQNINGNMLSKMPVSVPFISNKGRAEDKEISYTFSKVTFVQDDTLILKSYIPLSDDGITNELLLNTLVYVPYIVKSNYAKVLYFAPCVVTLVQGDTTILRLIDGVPSNEKSSAEFLNTPVAIPYIKKEKEEEVVEEENITEAAEN